MHSVNAVMNMNKDIRLIVSTDDQEIKDYCAERNIGIQKRSKVLSLDFAAKQEVIVDVCRELWEEEFYIPKTVKQSIIFVLNILND